MMRSLRDLKSIFVFLIEAQLCFSLGVFRKTLILTKVLCGWGEGMIKIGNLIRRKMVFENCFVYLEN